ncbi:ABC-three component system middle component 5 [Thalassospira xiamenensis]|uniref:ABC-three component system middle component 5 n=1 Tax=Thalassospira xiamenensis TaxID=220697 RepID=UPI003AA8D10A
MIHTRLWYPQFDIYDAIRRQGIIVSFYNKAEISLEFLFICDFYICNPSLMSRASMRADERKAFNSSGIPKPHQHFLSFPDERLLYAKMGGVQKQATKELAARGLIEVDRYKDAWIVATPQGSQLFDDWLCNNSEELEYKSLDFLKKYFAPVTEGGVRDLKKKTGLTRVL